MAQGNDGKFDLFGKRRVQLEFWLFHVLDYLSTSVVTEAHPQGTQLFFYV